MALHIVLCTAPPTEAGTGKSFLLTTVFLWCLCRKKKVKAAAPSRAELSLPCTRACAVGGMGATARYQHSRGRVRTGIAAANVEVEGTDVAATSHP
jgi:hypothetical protein